MIRFFTVRPFPTPAHRASRMQLLGCAVAGLAALVVWDPVARPGPVCCLLRRAVGLPCPVCGMTRGVAMCERGRFLEATLYNPLAVPVFVLALVLCAKWSYEFLTNRSVEVVLRPAWRIGLWASVYAVVLANWAYLLTFRREDDFAVTWLGQLLHFLHP